MEGLFPYAGDDGADNVDQLQQQLQRQLALQHMQQMLSSSSATPRAQRGLGGLVAVSPVPPLLGGENRISSSFSQSQQLVRQMGLNVEMLAKQVDHSNEKLKKHAQYINDLQDENKRLQQVAVTMKIDNDRLQAEVDKLTASETRNQQQIEQAERRYTDLKREYDALKRMHEEVVRNYAELKEKYAQLEEKCDFLTSDNQLLHRDVNDLMTRFEELRVSLRLTK